MPSDLRPRLALLLVLGAIGVGLAVAGTAVSATPQFTEPSSGATFVVSDQNLTLEQGERRVTVVDNMSRVERVDITRQEDETYHVATETETQVTDRERRRALSIARENATVQELLDGLDGYELTVEPIQQLTAEESEEITTTNTTGVDVTASKNVTFGVSVIPTNETVSVDREPTYVEDEFVVRVSDPETDETRYTVLVNVETGTVLDVDDRTDG